MPIFIVKVVCRKIDLIHVYFTVNAKTFKTDHSMEIYTKSSLTIQALVIINFILAKHVGQNGYIDVLYSHVFIQSMVG